MTLTKPRLSFAALAIAAVLSLGACATTGTPATQSYASTAKDLRGKRMGMESSYSVKWARLVPPRPLRDQN